MTCEYCNGDILSKWKSKKTRFCSKVCSNKFRKENTDYYEILSTKLKDKVTNGEKFGFHSIPQDKRKRRTYTKLSWHEKVMKRSFEDLSWDYKRRRVIIEQDSKCNSCGVSEWMGARLSLEVDHIDGNTDNNDRTNLEALCPNCHSLTNTFRGRNKARGKFPSSVELHRVYKEVQNIRQTLIRFNLAPKGDNYSKAKQMLQNEDMNIKFETTIHCS